ncbi:amidohydrolase family protein [Salinibacter grassmerensis]|uniref:amidohydrolase family protein n=1 Tax=Salinibacter grassmerensis TaxID=3040353 RepID=UPI0021E6E085|nr:amidohydrolase family protein [Salinibacter grassmerensis]
MRIFRSVLLALLLLAGLAVPAAAQPTALVGGTVHPVSGPAIEDGVVLLRGDTIAAVGLRGDVSIPADARRIDASGEVVTPGLMDAATATGLIEVSAVGETRDNALNTDDAIRAAFRVTDGINPNSVVVPVTRLGGVTTVASTPSGGAVAGQGAVIDLHGETIDEMLVRDRAALYAAFTPEAAEATGAARGGLAMRLREAFEDARFYAENRDNYRRGATRDLSMSRLDLEAMAAVLDGERPLVVRAARASDIDAALRIAEAFGIDLRIEGGEEAWMRADRLAAADVPVVVKALNNLPTAFDRLGTRFDNAARLAEAGVSVVISSFDTHNARNLRLEAGNAVRFGLDRDAALRAVTLAPARMLDVADTHGSLEAGKTANVVVWSGDPFEPLTSVEHVFIGGTEMPDDSRQKRLLRRYEDLGEWPPGYDDGS